MVKYIIVTHGMEDRAATNRKRSKCCPRVMVVWKMACIFIIYVKRYRFMYACICIEYFWKDIKNLRMVVISEETKSS